MRRSACVSVDSALQEDRPDVMLRPYIVYYKYRCPGDKKPGAVKQFRIYANSFDEARQLVSEQSVYPDIEVLDLKRV